MLGRHHQSGLIQQAVTQSSYESRARSNVGDATAMCLDHGARVRGLNHSSATC